MRDLVMIIALGAVAAQGIVAFTGFLMLPLVLAWRFVRVQRAVRVADRRFAENRKWQRTEP